MSPYKFRAPEKNIANIFCSYWTRREGKSRKINKNQAASAPDCCSLILKRDKDSENWMEIISSKHLKVKVFNLGLSFLLNFYIRESQKLLNAINTNIFYTFFFVLLGNE